LMKRVKYAGVGPGPVMDWHSSLSVRYARRASPSVFLYKMTAVLCQPSGRHGNAAASAALIVRFPRIVK
jgi:hypothetical protein